MTSLGQKLKTLRTERKMTQLQLGIGLVTPSMISQIESDRATPSPKLVEELAHRLGVDPTHFYDDIHQKNDQVHTYRKAKSLMELNQFDSALPLLESLLTPLAPQFREEVLYNDLADCYRQLGRFREAAEMYEAVVQISLEKDDVSSAVRGYYNLGIVHRRSGELGMARIYWQRASHMLERHTELKMPLAMRIESSLGQTCVHLKLYDLALQSYRRAAAFARQYESVIDIALTHHGLASLYIYTGHLDQAEGATNLALDAYKSAQRLRGVVQCTINKCQIMRLRGHHEGAIQCLTQLISSGDVHRDSEVCAHALYERALNFLTLKQLDRAAADAKAGLQCEKDSNENRRSLHLLLADAYTQQERWKLVMEHAKAAQAMTDSPSDFKQALHVQNLIHRAAIALSNKSAAVESVLETAQIALKM